MNREQRRREQKTSGLKKDRNTKPADPIASAGLEITNAPQPVDLTKDGSCSRCGGCCGSILSVTMKELRSLQEWAEKNSFKPRTLVGDDVADMQCPFLTRHDDGTTECACYSARPSVCHTFDCRNSNERNAKAWLAKHPEYKPGSEPPVPRNIWQVFGLTGLKLEGRDIPYYNGPRCRVKNDEGDTYEFFVGRPVRLRLVNSTDLPWSMVIGLYQNGLQIFSALSHELEFIAYSDIAEVSSENRVETIEDDSPVTSQADREAIKSAMADMKEEGDEES